ncbi:hypothetical protein KTT_18650 [Tengunoibacter tsumagoiensis]|uniref:Uncharacterized protein n=1 Tax=Tengunoibacter tsumagoiensis TaxID=2014871 RepID=A0A401ZYS6_9CHLR|nr:hypothetical protein KTT_18650 [Tengunoibacter tsumagoiensis]
MMKEGLKPSVIERMKIYKIMKIKGRHQSWVSDIGPSRKVGCLAQELFYWANIAIQNVIP